MTAPPGEARLRDDVRQLIRAALEAVDPAALTAGALRRDPLEAPPPGEGELILVAVGKAAPGMARGVLDILPPDRVSRGMVLHPEGPEVTGPLPAPLRRVVGGHPLPTAAGVRATRTIKRWLEEAGEHDTVLLLLSGGGSALLTLPMPGITLEDLRTTTGLLLRSGAPIQELNTVRKHLEEAKGGRLARAAAPAVVRALVISDVVGDRLDVVASGPVSPDPTTYAEALEVLERWGVRERTPLPVVRLLERGAAGELPETPGPEDPCFRRVRATVVGSVGTAVEAAAGEAARRGYAPRTLTLALTGEAREAGRRLGRVARRAERRARAEGPGRALLAGGETTVTVTSGGRGGRNQEVALGAAGEVEGLDGVLVASVGTDGVDGPTDAAGALATGSTLRRARAAGLDAQDALRENDAYPFFRRLDDLVVTGPTGTNVMDVQVVLVRLSEPPAET